MRESLQKAIKCNETLLKRIKIKATVLDLDSLKTLFKEIDQDASRLKDALIEQRTLGVNLS